MYFSKFFYFTLLEGGGKSSIFYTYTSIETIWKIHAWWYFKNELGAHAEVVNIDAVFI